ncbi:MAG: hypothetical protein J7L96_08805, partial [Bacteroidales bacterium]|nr:hypothetical protein [Bacteroidales bacterium]
MVDPKIESRLRNSDNIKLLDFLSQPDDYLPEVFEVVRDEVERRGGVEAVKASIQAQNEAEVKVEEAQYQDIPLSEYRYPNLWIGIGLASIDILVLSAALAFDKATDIPLFAASGVLFFLTYVYWLVCIYKIHSLLRQHTKGKYPITPGQAVGLGFLPIYNLYWMFRWTNQLIAYVNDADLPKKSMKWWPGFWLWCSLVFLRDFPPLSCMIKFIVGIRLFNRVRMAIEKQDKGKHLPLKMNYTSQEKNHKTSQRENDLKDFYSSLLQVNFSLLRNDADTFALQIVESAKRESENGATKNKPKNYGDMLLDLEIVGDTSDGMSLQ